MTPLTITKDEHSGKYVAWHLPSDKVVEFTNEGQSEVFWKCTSNFYLLGVGDTKEEAISKFICKFYNFSAYLAKCHGNLSIDNVTSNLPEYRQAIYEFNTEKLF